MLKKLNKDNQGFTIIEVMIVLAIAGLILLIVFLAIPALQRNGRNTQRKADVQAVLGGISSYVANNDGTLPTSFGQIQTEVKVSFYTGATDVDFATGGTAIPSPDPSKLYVRTGAKCNGINVTATGATSRSVAALYVIESPGGTTWKCQES